MHPPPPARRPGRPPRADGAASQRLELSAAHVAKAREIGQRVRGNAAPSPGDLVAGVRAAIDAHHAQLFSQN